MKQKEETYAKLIPYESHESELHYFINFLAKLYSKALRFSSTPFPELPPFTKYFQYNK